ncbi:unnamed protein product [Peniophora sp. CBMAI 1063]|nr:unnamed protein product [Peniophora sp. CBMAI 1063]
MAVLHDLAPELVDVILFFVPPRQLPEICLCSRWLNDLISRSSLAQYRIKCTEVGVLEDILPGPSYPERLSALHRYLEAWRTLEVQRRVEVQIPSLLAMLYDFTGGHLALLDSNTAPYSYATVKLPNAREGAGRWTHTEVPYGILTEFAFSVEDHDLAVALTYRGGLQADPPQTNAAGSAIWVLRFELHLHSLSGGDAHPAAILPIVPVCNAFSSATLPSASVLVAGECVLIMLVHEDPEPFDNSDDVLYSVHWKTGAVHEVARFPRKTHMGLVFLRHDIILFCNMETKALEAYVISFDPHTPQLPMSLVFLCSLILPLPGVINGYQCRSEPNVQFPTTSASEHQTRYRPKIRNDPKYALVHFSIQHDASATKLVVHRHKLLAAALVQQGNLMVPYEQWGCNICTWLEHSIGGWITNVDAQRVVKVELAVGAHPAGGPWNINVYDFNTSTVRRTKEELGDGRMATLWNGSMIEVHEGTSVPMPLPDAPEHRLESRVPCVQTTLKDAVRYVDVMIDGERILGLYRGTAADSRFTLLEVLAFA